tara:strand:+ start:363 stop:920 length:558 start_codon:yes stop_codon:yes gene_type:complete
MPSLQDIAKPRTGTKGIVSVLIEAATETRTEDGNADGVITPTTNDRLFRIKPAAVQLGFSVEVADVTGETDASAQYTHNEMTRGSFTVQGYAMSSDTGATDGLGLRFLQSAQNGQVVTTGKTANIRFQWANGKSIYGIALVESIQYSYSRSSVFVGVTMSGRFTNTNFSKKEFADSNSADLPTGD